MPIIDLKTVNKKQDFLADMFAQQELNDFNELFAILQQQCSTLFLFKNIDFEDIRNQIENNIKSNHFNNNGKLKYESMKNINSFYGERVDLDELYESYNNGELK